MSYKIEKPFEFRDYKPVRDGWIEFLSRWEWQWFTTHTFRESVHPEKADKLFRYWMNRVNEKLYGKRFRQHGRGIFGVKALEYQQRGVPHFHCLLAGTGLDAVQRIEHNELWNELAGYARIYPPRNQEAVTGYCSKYVVKGGEIECVGVFPANPAASLIQGVPCATRATESLRVGDLPPFMAALGD